METQFKFKKDIYREKRGGYSRFLNIFCNSCGAHLLLYQKDGPGELRRLYLDRILAPEIIFSAGGEYICHSCKKIIGTFCMFEKENRQIIRLYQGAIFKKIGTGVYPLQKN